MSDKFWNNVTTIVAVVALIVILCMQTGCATVERYCDEQPAVCATVAAACVAGVAIVVVHKLSPPGVQVHQNAPVAPITVPCTNCSI